MLADYGLKLKSDYFISCALNELALEHDVDFPPRFFTASHFFFAYAFEHGVVSENNMCLISATCSEIAVSLGVSRIQVHQFLSFLSSIGVVERVPNGGKNGRNTFVSLSVFTDKIS